MECDIAFRLRYQAVVERGWVGEQALGSGVEVDDYDSRAVHVIGWDDDTPIATGRLVLPPGPLPTEDACGIVVEPAGNVVDVGRMVVVPTHQAAHHGAFVALLCALYAESRMRGFEVACGMMSPTVRGLMRHLGLRLEVLGEARRYWDEDRSPVRFELSASAPTLSERWD